MDDYLSAGSSTFENDVMVKLREKYSFGKIEKDSFTFTGIEVSQQDDGKISLVQSEFANDLQYHELDKKNDSTKLLGEERGNNQTT